MANNLEFYQALERIKVITTGNKEKYYYLYIPEEWDELKEILIKYNITIPSRYEIKFNDEDYKIIPDHDFSSKISAKIFYKDTEIAYGYVDGSNYCDQRAYMNIYLNKLDLVYN